MAFSCGVAFDPNIVVNEPLEAGCWMSVLTRSGTEPVPFGAELNEFTLPNRAVKGVGSTGVFESKGDTGPVGAEAAPINCCVNAPGALGLSSSVLGGKNLSSSRFEFALLDTYPSTDGATFTYRYEALAYSGCP